MIIKFWELCLPKQICSKKQKEIVIKDTPHISEAVVRRCSVKKVKFTGKHLYWSLFLKFQPEGFLFLGRSTCYSKRLHGFFVTIPRSYKDIYVNSFFPCTATLWNYLATECFPLTYDLSGFKTRINRHLLTVVSFQTPCLMVAVHPCME